MNLTSNYIEYLIKRDSVIIEFKHFENGLGNLLNRASRMVIRVQNFMKRPITEQI